MLTRIDHYFSISDRLVTAGQPTAEQLVVVQQAGFEVVVNLALPTSDRALPDEPALVERLGMTYVALPVVWEQPKINDFQHFQTIMEKYRDRRIFVHCAANMRVSVFVYLYRCLTGTPPTEAATALHAIWHPNPTWQALIDEVLSTAGKEDS